MTTRQKLSVDLDSLFPGSSITIGNQSIVIRPLGIEQLSIIVKKLNGITSVLSENGITWDNFSNPQNLIKLAFVILENAPDILEEAANVDIDDLKKLPIEIIVEILNKIIEENMKSKEQLEKNFMSLIEKFTVVTDQITDNVEKKAKKSPTKKIRK